MSSQATSAVPRQRSPQTGISRLDSFFKISERGSTFGREVRGGFATFFTMAYIVVLNPIILGSAADKFGNHLSVPQLATATALVAAVMTVIMGVSGNVPLAIAAGLGLNGVVAFQIAPTMSWPDAMGLVVLEGIAICLLVVTGLREAIMNSIPMALKQAISVGIGLFIAFIGFVDAGFVTKGQGTPVQLGTGQLTGWPVLVFCFGVLLTLILLVRKTKGALLLGIVITTVLAVIVNKAAGLSHEQWGLNQPTLPKKVFSLPDFGLIGHFSLFGGFAEAGVITAMVFVFTLVLSDFFDAMGTIIGVTNEAGLLDKKGRLPGIGKILFIDGVAAAAGGAGSASSNTAFIESAAGVGEGARTGFANVITGGLLAFALLLTPLTTIVPSQAAAPALIAVGFLMMTQVKNIDWNDFDIAIPAFLTMVLMPFTYSITNGIGAGFIAFVAIKAARGKPKEPGILLWVIAVMFAAYFALNPIEQLLGMK
jgi:AGZA family xanthine/uracil permease-like MFS transporter